MRFKDASELHIFSMKIGRPELFDEVTDPLIEEAIKRASLTTSSSSSLGYDEGERSYLWDEFGAFRFSDMGDPEPPKYLVRNFVEEAQPTYVYGGRGTLKSIAAAALAIAIASPEVSEVLGFPVEEHGPVILFDSEMNDRVFNKRITELCAGLGITDPRNLYYMNALGMPPNESFPKLHRLATYVNAVAVTIDSWGFATRSNPEAYDEVRNDAAEYLHPLLNAGVSPIIVEHKPHQGDHLFGSVLKEYHGRYIFKTEGLDGEARTRGERNIRLVNKKASFSDEGQKVDLFVRFDKGKITLENLGAPEEDLENFATPDATVRVRRALEDGYKTRVQIAEHSGLSDSHLSKLLPKMAKGEVGCRIYVVGQEGRAYVYGLIPPEQLTSSSSSSSSSLGMTKENVVNSKDVLGGVKNRNPIDEPNFPNTSPDQKFAQNKVPVTRPEELTRILEVLKGADEIAIDLETMPPEGWESELVPAEGWRRAIAQPYRRWRKNLKRTPTRERCRTKWEECREKVQSRVEKMRPSVYKKYAVNPESARVRLVSLATEHLNEVLDASVLDIASLFEVLQGKTLITHNGSFDLAVLRERYGYIHEGRVLDTQKLYVLHHYAHGGKRSVIRDGKWRLPDPLETKIDIDGQKLGMTALKAVVKKYLPEVELEKAQQSAYWSTPELSPEMVSYALLDSRVLLELSDVLRSKLEELGMSAVVDMESRETSAKIWMERNGMPVSVATAEAMSARYQAEAEAAFSEMIELLPAERAPDGEDWSWTKDRHVRAVLELLGANLEELQKTTKTKEPSVSKDSLSQLSGPPGALKWRDAYLTHKDRSRKAHDFIDKYASLVRENGTIAGRFEDVSTGRKKCVRPNLQQVPKRGELQTVEGMRIRDIFRAREGEVLIVADFAQVELLLAATIAERRSGTKSKMLEVFRAGEEDIHYTTAAWVLKKPVTEVTDQERSLAKAINFGLIYGCSAQTLLESAALKYGVKGMTLKAAKRYRKAFFEKYPEFASWHEEVKHQCHQGHGYATTPLGRQRKLPKWAESNEVAFTTAVNHPVQGAGADAIKLTMAKLFEDQHNCPGNPRLNCCVHDEVILSVEEQHKYATIAWVQAHMAAAEREAIGDPESPIVVDVKGKASWA